MTAAIKNASSVLAVHKLTILFFVLFSLQALGTSILGALSGAEWGALNGQARFLIVVAILTNWIGVLLAFFRSSITKLARGENPVAETTPPIPLR